MCKIELGWIVTDPGPNQRCRQISETEFEFKEFSDFFEKEVNGTINLNDYSDKQKREYLSPYGYQLEGIEPSLLAKCIWETDFIDFCDL